MLSIQDITKALDIEGAKEVILAAGATPAVKLKRGIEFFSHGKIKPDDVRNLLLNLKQRSKLVNKPLGNRGQFSVGLPGVGRLQVFYSVQRGSYLMAIKKVNDTPPMLREIMQNPLDRDAILSVFHDPKGFILIHSPSEEPAHDFIAAILNYLSRFSKFAILTIEDPITYVLRHEQSLILQTEIGQDIESIAEGIKTAHFLNPDVVYVSKLKTASDLRELLSIIERGNMVILPAISTSLASSMLSLERLLEDPVLFRNITAFFFRTCFSLKETEKGRIDVKPLNITQDLRDAIKEGDYTKLLNG